LGDCANAALRAQLPGRLAGTTCYTEDDMWKKLATFFTELSTGDEDPGHREDELRVATAALLVHASRIDGRATPEETDRLHVQLRAQFDLSDAEAADLAEAGRTSDAEAVDLYRFTRVLTDRLDPAGRARVVEMLWEIVLSDHVIDDYEANLVWRVAELLHVPTRERVVLRRQVAERLGVDI
jgi:uncharacterized tellurite resistance protein B-like protein